MVIYTAIFGDYDILREGEHKGRKVIFTDREQEVTSWEVVRCASEFEDSTRSARQKKILSHIVFPDEDYVVWMDGSLEMKIDFNEDILESLLGRYDMALYPHKYRSCIYQEARACKDRNKDDHNIINAQMKRYREDGYPPGIGLAETGFLIRRNTQQVKEFNEMWWSEVQKGSRRDQLSFNYCLWKLGTKVRLIRPGDVYGNNYFCWVRHPKKA